MACGKVVDTNGKGNTTPKKCGEVFINHVGTVEEVICSTCWLKKQRENVRVVINEDGTASFKGPLVGMGF